MASNSARKPKKPDFLIEVSHEAANKMGGLYTFLAGKLKFVDRNYKQYLVVGPYDKRNSGRYFFEEPLPSGYSKIFRELEREGIGCKYGKWSEDTTPDTILLDWGKLEKRKKKIYSHIRKTYGIDTRYCGKYANWILSGEYLLWSTAVSSLLRKIVDAEVFDGEGVVHFHQFTSCTALADLKRLNYNVGLVYTDHATALFSSLVRASHSSFEKIMDKFLKNHTRLGKTDYKKDSYTHLSMQSEKVCFENSDVYCCVSDINRQKTEFIYDKKKAIVTPNGIDISIYPTLEDRAVQHQKYKEKIYEFLHAYFLPYYPIDVENSLLFFTSGRDDWAKGYDIIVEALADLNEKLKKENYEKNIFMFFFVFVPFSKVNPAVIENISIYRNIIHNIETEIPHLQKRILHALIHGGPVDSDLLTERFERDIVKFRHVLRLKSRTHPPITAFNLKHTPPLLRHMEEKSLTNKKEDKVKVIFYPAPVSLTDNVLSLDYHELIKGMHLGIFPSLNEPWGYTPLETAACGLPSITTNLSGFGHYVQENITKKPKGLIILDRKNQDNKQTSKQLCKTLYNITKLTRGQRINLKEDALRIAKKCDWESFYKYHLGAHALAIQKKNNRRAHKKT
ncbi:glycosyltransferase [Candidatus Altiarchaeota archaeon]